MARAIDLERIKLQNLMDAHEVTDFERLDRVAYFPPHADYDIEHDDVVWGVVSSTNPEFVFVKFDIQIRNIGFEDTTAQACDPQRLIKLI